MILVNIRKKERDKTKGMKIMISRNYNNFIVECMVASFVPQKNTHVYKKLLDKKRRKMGLFHRLLDAEQ